MTLYYFNGATLPVAEAIWRSEFYNSFTPVPCPHDGTADDFPDIPKGRIAELRENFGMMLQAELVMEDGSVPDDLEQYTFRIFIYGNDFRAKFRVEDGVAFAEWGMGREGWKFLAQDGRTEGLCFVSRDDGNWDCDAVQGIGWFPSASDGHTHAKMTWVISPGPVEQHNLVLHSIGSGDIVGLAGQYAHGAKVPLRAVPRAGNRFVQWDIVVGSSTAFLFEPEIEVEMIGDTIVTASFEPSDVPVTDVEAAAMRISALYVQMGEISKELNEILNLLLGNKEQLWPR
jgi:hypothetical protein